MYSRPRIIPTLLISGDDLVKTKKFNTPNYLGDPLNAIKIFNEKSVDELCILDIDASKNDKAPNFELLEKMAKEAFMPLSYGGGISSVQQAREVFRLGFEKIVVNTICIKKPEVVSDMVSYFGSQSIVGAIDYKKSMFGKSYCYCEDGHHRIKKTSLEMAIEMERLGCGEILLYDMKRDGMRTGYDLATIKIVADSVSIPIISCGGADSLKDIKEALGAGANAVAAGSLFVYFGARNAVLINYPSESSLYEMDIYRD